MGNESEYTVHDLVRAELYKNMDIEYGKFSAKLCPSCGNMIGVRIPVLRKMAKEIASVNWKEYLDGAVDDTFEEIMLQCLVVGYAKGDIDVILDYLRDIVPKVDNWSLCDTLCSTFKIAKRYQKEVWEFILHYLNPPISEAVFDSEEAAGSPRDFKIRFAVVMMMAHFLNDEYIDKVLYAYNSIYSKKEDQKYLGYYAKMGVAWGLATAFAKYPGKTMEFMKNNDLDDETQNKAIQKMRESYRVSPKDKEALKLLKR